MLIRIEAALLVAALTLIRIEPSDGSSNLFACPSGKLTTLYYSTPLLAEREMSNSCSNILRNSLALLRRNVVLFSHMYRFEMPPRTCISLISVVLAVIDKENAQ